MILIIPTALCTFQLDKPNCQSGIFEGKLYAKLNKVRQIDYGT